MPNVTGGNNIVSTNQIANGVIEDADVNAAAAIAASKIAGDVETTGDQSVAGIKTFTDSPVVPTEAYGAGWSGDMSPPTKDALYTKIEALSSPLVLLKAGSGTSNAAGATILDSIALSGLTDLDTIEIHVNIEQFGGGPTNTLTIYTSTDSQSLLGIDSAGTLANGTGFNRTIWLRQSKRQTSEYNAWSRGMNMSAVDSDVNKITAGLSSWQGSWTLALRHAGVTAGTLYWSWAVYKKKGQ